MPEVEEEVPVQINSPTGEGKKRRERIIGYRFKPKDEELIEHYLMNKSQGLPLPMDDIKDVMLYDFNPQTLTATYPKIGDDEWYFFTPRFRKYANGSRPQRSAGDGFWKATGVEKVILKDKLHPIGKKRSLVFYRGSANSKNQNSGKTSWVMHEFTLIGKDRASGGPDDMMLNDFVLCMLRENSEKKKSQEEKEPEKETKKKPRSDRKNPDTVATNTAPVSGGGEEIKEEEGHMTEPLLLPPLPLSMVGLCGELDYAESILMDPANEIVNLYCDNPFDGYLTGIDSFPGDHGDSTVFLDNFRKL